MTLKFSANLSTLFNSVDFLHRFEHANKLGFKAFEVQFPYDFSPELISQNKFAMSCDLINLYCQTPFGCASLPTGHGEFNMATQRAIPYYNALNFRKLHILSGDMSKMCTEEEQIGIFVENLKSLVESDYLENRNLTALIEPICEEVNPNYLLNSYEKAVEILKSVGSDQVKLLLDVYHLHKITGDVKKYLPIYYPYAGHIQISQSPGRSAPFTPDGEIDFEFVFNFLKEKNHSDFIGLEYYHSGTSPEDFEWMKKY